MKTLKVATCQTFTTRVLTGRKKCKDSNEKKNKTIKQKQQQLTWRESGHLFFVLHVCLSYFFFLYKTVFDRNIL